MTDLPRVFFSPPFFFYSSLRRGHESTHHSFSRNATRTLSTFLSLRGTVAIYLTLETPPVLPSSFASFIKTFQRRQQTARLRSKRFFFVVVVVLFSASVRRAAVGVFGRLTRPAVCLKTRRRRSTLILFRRNADERNTESSWSWCLQPASLPHFPLQRCLSKQISASSRHVSQQQPRSSLPCRPASHELAAIATAKLVSGSGTKKLRGSRSKEGELNEHKPTARLFPPPSVQHHVG